MPTVVTQSIGSGGGRDYSTLQAWFDAAPADLTSADEQHTGECYNDSNSFVESTGNLLNMAGKTVDATRYFHLTAAAGQSFQDDAGVRANALSYNQSKGVGLEANTSYAGWVVLNAPSYTRFSRLQFTSSTAGELISFVVGAQDVMVKDCLFQHIRQRMVDGPGYFTIRNCVFFLTTASANGFAVIQSYYQNSTVHGCTFVRTSDVSATGVAIGFSTGSCTVDSCAFFGFATPINTTATGSTGNNATDQSSGLPGSNNQHSVTFTATAPFEQAAVSGYDLRAKSAGALAALGLYDGTNAPNDISGTARANPPTIGAWELVTGGTTFTVDLSGSITPAGALPRQTNKSTAGASTPGGALARAVLKASAGTLTSAGTVTGQTSKGLSGSTTPAGAAAKAASKAFAGALTLSGALLRFLPRSYAGDLTPQGDLFRQPQKGLAGAVTSSSILTRAVSLLRAGTVTPGGALAKTTTKAAAGTTTPTGSVTTIRAVLLSLAGTLSLAGSVQRTVNKGLSASLATSGALARMVSKRFAGAVTPIGALLKQARKALASLLGLGGEVQTGTGPAVHPARRQAFTSFVVRDAFDSVAMHPQPFTSNARNTRRFDSWSED